MTTLIEDLGLPSVTTPSSSSSSSTTTSSAAFTLSTSAELLPQQKSSSSGGSDPPPPAEKASKLVAIQTPSPPPSPFKQVQQKKFIATPAATSKKTETQKDKTFRILANRLKDKQTHILHECADVKTWGKCHMEQKELNLLIWTKTITNSVEIDGKMVDQSYPIFKSSVTFPKCSYSTIKNVLYDVNNIVKWNATLTESKIIIDNIYDTHTDIVYNKTKKPNIVLEPRDFVMVRRCVDLSEKDTEPQKCLISSLSLSTSDLEVLAAANIGKQYKKSSKKATQTVRGWANPGGFFIEALTETSCKITWIMNIFPNVPGPKIGNITVHFTVDEIQDMTRRLIAHVAKKI